MTQPPQHQGQPYPYGSPQQYPHPQGSPQPQGYPQPQAGENTAEPIGNAYSMPAVAPMGPPSGAAGGMAPTGTLVLNVQGSPLVQSIVPPSLTINGHPVRLAYGRNVIPCPPGPQHLSMHLQWMRRYGQAELDLNMAPGQTVEVFYAGPYHQFTHGQIGFQPQKHHGLGLLFGILGGTIGFILLMFLVIALV